MPQTADASLDDSAQRGDAACFELNLPTGRILFFNLHLASPHAALGEMLNSPTRAGAMLCANSKRRRFESQAIRRRAAEAGDAVVLAGDFNMPPDDPTFRNGWSGYSDAFSDRGFGWGHTYATHRGSLRIDHILTGLGTQCVRCWVGSPVGSPHRPLIADIQLSDPLTGGGAK